MKRFVSQPLSEGFLRHARWMVPPGYGEAVDAYWEVVCEFKGCGDLILEISADARYAAWCNGGFVGSGPYADWPGTRSVDAWSLAGFVQKGSNELCVLVHQIGEGTASYVPGDPGVAFAVSDNVKVLAASGADCRWRRSPFYQSGTMPRITPQLGFGFSRDANADASGENWERFAISDTRSLEETGRQFRARPIPPCERLGRAASRVVAQGVFRRAANPDEHPLAWRMQRDWLAFREAGEIFPGCKAAPLSWGSEGLTLAPDAGLADGADGVWLVVDLGREMTGFVEIESEAAAAVQFEIAWGQHLDDLRVRSQVGNRYFASSYRSAPGRQLYIEPLTRIGGRYLQVHICGGGERVRLIHIGLRESAYPLPDPAPCPSEDALDRAIYDLSVRTLRLCMGDHYDDTPWREQGLYANDALNQSLAGYAVFGEVRYPQASLDLLGGGLREDGFLELCAPAKIPITIPAFTFAWVLAVWKNIEFANDASFAGQQADRVSRILETSLGRLVNGLLPSPNGAEYWHFYDWTAGGLDGTVEGDATRFATLSEIRFDAPLQAFFLLALEAGARVLESAGQGSETSTRWRVAAEQVRHKATTVFLPSLSDRLHTFADATHRPMPFPPSELAHALALLAGIIPAERADETRSAICHPEDHGLIPSSLSQSLYSFLSLCKDPAWRDRALERLRRTWGAMLAGGATACWETGEAGWAFDRASSLCHGWSAIPACIIGMAIDGQTARRPFV